MEGDSNTVVIPFIPQNVSTTVVKTADLQAATIGDVITFTTVITNTGDTVTNIRFQDMFHRGILIRELQLTKRIYKLIDLISS